MSFVPVLAGNLVFRLAGAATGLMLTLYVGWINRELYPVSATTLGLLAGSFYLVEIVGAPLLGAQSDRRGRRPFLLVGPALGCFAVQLTGLTTALGLLFLTRLLEGLVGAAVTPALLGQLAERTEGDPVLRGRVMSMFEAGTALGLTFGSVSGSLLWDVLGRPGFFVIAALYLVSLALFWRTDDRRWATDDDRPPTAANSPSSVVGRPSSLITSLQTVVGYRSLLGFMPAWLAVNAVVGLWLTHAIFQMSAGREMAGQYLVGAFPGRTIAAILSGYAITFGIGLAGWGYAFRWLGEVTMMRIALVGMLGAAASILAMNHSGGPGPLLWAAVGCFGVSVLVESGFAPGAVSYLARLSSEMRQDRGLVMGLYSVVLGLGQLLGGWIGGPFADRWGMDGVLGPTFGLGLLALWLTLRLKRES
ncbi:MAG TPA: MFS transporter [Chloroflexota bacterium]|nr:MFS transporter [Chloroflexota bacterium]